MEQARPGMVGSVGDAIVVPQLATSMPGMSPRYDPSVYLRQTMNGSNLTAQPLVTDSAWAFGRSEQVAYGMRQQDIRPPDMLHEPVVNSIRDYNWSNKVATVYEAKVRGNKFLPLPGAYQLMPGETSRGSQVVRVTDVEGAMTDQLPQPSIFGKSTNEREALPVTDSLVDNRPKTNLLNSSGNFTLMAPQSGLGSSSRYFMPGKV